MTLGPAGAPAPGRRASIPAAWHPDPVRALHHLDLWVTDRPVAEAEWGWLLGRLGWQAEFSDEAGASWLAEDGTYLFLQELPGPGPAHDRMGAGWNHLAFTLDSRASLDQLRSASSEHGWHELFADRYPHAGGEEHVALYLADSEGFEVEVVVER